MFLDFRRRIAYCLIKEPGYHESLIVHETKVKQNISSFFVIFHFVEIVFYVIFL